MNKNLKKVRVLAMQLNRELVFQAEGPASAKAIESE